MKSPKQLKVKETGYYGGDSLMLSHLSDTKKCHVMTSSYGEITSASLTKTDIRRVVNWLNRWLKFKDADHEKAEVSNE